MHHIKSVDYIVQFNKEITIALSLSILNVTDLREYTRI